MVDDGSIVSILRQDDPRLAAQDLLDEALGRGGKDNVTIAVDRYQVTGGWRTGAGLRSTEFEPTTDSLDVLPDSSCP